MYCVFFFFKQKTAYEMRISDWSSDVCSSDLRPEVGRADGAVQPARLRGRVRVDGDADVRRRAGAGALGKERRPGRGGPRAADRAPDAGATGDNMTDWYYHDPAQGRVGPLSAEQVRARSVDCRIHPATLPWHTGAREWQPLDRFSDELQLDTVAPAASRSEEHTSELQSLMRIS